MRTVVAAFVLIGFGTLAALVVAQEQPSCVERAAALRLFSERVETYTRLHCRLEEGLPPMTATTGSFSMLVAKRYLAAAIRTARPTARQGNIFSPAIAWVFRQLIAETFEGRDVEAFVVDLNRYPVVRGSHPLVNEPYPKEVTYDVPAFLLARLPALSEHVEYRIVDYDLLLWDAHADLVIDFVPDAFGPPPTTDGAS